MIFKGKNLSPMQSDSIAIGDVVCINGIVGFFDGLTSDTIWLVDENEQNRPIKLANIESVVRLTIFTEGNISSISINELKAA